MKYISMLVAVTKHALILLILLGATKLFAQQADAPPQTPQLPEVTEQPIDPEDTEALLAEALSVNILPHKKRKRQRKQVQNSLQLRLSLLTK
jgi:hypothetical protein